MSEWWTYTLSDFLLFSARTYYRLFELYNREIWPAQLLAITLGIVLVACLLRGGALQGKAVAAILAACWLWVAWAFHVERYAAINSAAFYFAAAFVIQALLLVWIGVVRERLLFKATGNPVNLAALCMVLFALLVHPLIGPLLGRPWLQAEIFGVAPDPTVVATLGILLMGRPRWILFPIPILWCVVSGATLWAMESRDALMMPLMAFLVLLLAARRDRTAPSIISPPHREPP